MENFLYPTPKCGQGLFQASFACFRPGIYNIYVHLSQTTFPGGLEKAMTDDHLVLIPRFLDYDFHHPGLPDKISHISVHAGGPLRVSFFVLGVILYPVYRDPDALLHHAPLQETNLRGVE
jgi:hypothetical protein